jgi:asparagine synthase (glutamine-hydrolysing)
MCGIAGFLRTASPSAGKDVLVQMGNVIRHRGPDAGGEYLDDYVGLAHRRLSIIDLSAQGNQPMFSSDRRKIIVFNGEIYNFQELKNALQQEGVQFRTRTDTEVLLALYEKYGTDCLSYLNGMFAFALWDIDKKQLFLARDRIGKKPLYFYHGGDDRLAFASELKSLLEIPGIPREVDPTAVADYLKYLYVPDPKSIYKNIYKLSPGHYLTIRVGEKPVDKCYWDVNFSAADNLTVEAASEELLTLLRDSTVCRMIADVPLGAFLSGGIDSSAIVALMAKNGKECVKTCSIGFSDKRHDETPHAREVSQLFNTEHAEYFVQDDLPATVGLLPRFFDEPFADSSAVPTYHVSRLARQAVTVALSGDGGDENFGGYTKYTTDRIENLTRQWLPRPLLRLLHDLAIGRSGVSLRKLRTLTLGALSDPAQAFYRTNSFVTDEQLQLLLADDLKQQISGYDPAEHIQRHWDNVRGADHLTGMLYTDIKTYLPGDILVKVDRMSMANSLEVRAPILDYRVVEFAAKLPSRLKINGSNKKFILKKTFAQLLPEKILNRRKQGFTVPLDSWFRSDLRELSQQCFFADEGIKRYFSVPGLRKIWDEHQSYKNDHGTLLWSLLMFALWHNEYQV